MRQTPKTAYELSESQVSTPPPIISLFWKITHQHRKNVGAVLDMGAGDARFAKGGKFKSYVGIEIDRSRSRPATIPENGRLMNQCAFRHRATNYDACIGNPPYVRHHDLEFPWKNETVEQLEKAMGVSLNRNANLYLHFMCLGLIKTHERGLVSLVIPYEWVSRPSAKPIRDYITEKKWSVNVYRFRRPIFEGVLTTACVTIIDKSDLRGEWKYFDISSDFKIYPKEGIADSSEGVIDYAKPGEIHAMRGLSPGSQELFTLTEGERIRHGLDLKDVIPCVTTFRYLSDTITTLNEKTFKQHFVEAGQRCWLIQSYKENLSPALCGYLANIPVEKRNNYTCANQFPWYKYSPHPIPKILISSGFVNFGPKVIINEIGASAIGSVFGVHTGKSISLPNLRAHLRAINFESRLVAHARTLKKIEVKQFNSVLNQWNKFHGKAPR